MAKRLFDLALAGVALAVLAVPMLLVALAIRWDSPGPALYRQTRVGRHGRPFQILKFRTMAAAPSRSELTVHNDARITRIGHRLRRRRIDEWPQLFNVLRGEMSVVGPRPEVPRFVDHYPPALKAQVLSVRPGITDPAALAFRNEAESLAGVADPEQHYLRVILPAKVALQAEYVRQMSLQSDLLLVWRTLAVLLGRA